MNKSRKFNSPKWLAASALLSAAILAVVVATIMLTTSGTSVMAQNNDDPDSTRDGAVDLGDITGQHRAKAKNYSIDGVGDIVDYYSFSLTDTREVMVKLSRDGAERRPVPRGPGRQRARQQHRNRRHRQRGHIPGTGRRHILHPRQRHAAGQQHLQTPLPGKGDHPRQRRPHGLADHQRNGRSRPYPERRHLRHQRRQRS